MFLQRFLRTFICKESVSNHWELNDPSVVLYIYYMVDKGKSSFLQNIVEEIRPGCRNLQIIMVNLLEIFLGGMMLEVKYGV